MLLNTSTAIEMSRRLAWALSQCRWSGGTRRNHRRTVDSGRSIRTAMRRNPRPFALCVNAFPMTSVVSARRTCSSAGNSTWVLVHAVQRARAGCTVTVLAPDPRTVRMRPCPHLVRTPPHSGHAIAPDARCLWASSAHTITITAADSAHGCSVLLGTTLPHEGSIRVGRNGFRRHRQRQCRRPGAPSPRPGPSAALASTSRRTPSSPRWRCRRTKPIRKLIGKPHDGNPRVHRHPERLSTARLGRRRALP